MNKAINNGCTPLFIASQKGHCEVVSKLLDKGATIDQLASIIRLIVPSNHCSKLFVL